MNIKSPIDQAMNEIRTMIKYFLLGLLTIIILTALITGVG